MKNIGKTINLVGGNGEWRAGRVVDYDKHIGLTIVSTTDSNKYLLCQIGPSSPLWKAAFWNEGLKIEYFERFEQRQQQIEMGLIDLRILSTNSGRQLASAETCPFGQ